MLNSSENGNKIGQVQPSENLVLQGFTIEGL
jgi:hypothetical protein